MRISLFIMLVVACVCSVAAQYGLRSPAYLASLSSHASSGSAPEISKSGLLSWYDFNDATDSHNVGPYHLSESNSPSYQDGYGMSRASSTSFWKQTAISTHWLTNASESYTWVARVRGDSGLISGSYLLYFKAGRVSLRHFSPSNTVKIGQNSTTTYTVATETNKWWNIVAIRPAGTTNVSVWVNGVEFTAAEAFSTSPGDAIVGTDSSGGGYARNGSFSFLGFFKRAWTTNEVAALGTNDITYAQLAP